MRKNLPFIFLFVVVAVVVGGYLGFTSLNAEKKAVKNQNVKAVPPNFVEGDTASSLSPEQQTGDREEKVSPQTIEETNVENADPKAGEKIVWGEIKAVDVEQRVLTIDQEMDDNSVKISPNVPVNQEAIIRTKQEVISLARIKPGDNVGVIITEEGQARAVLVNY